MARPRQFLTKLSGPLMRDMNKTNNAQRRKLMKKIPKKLLTKIKKSPMSLGKSFNVKNIKTKPNKRVLETTNKFFNFSFIKLESNAKTKNSHRKPARTTHLYQLAPKIIITFSVRSQKKIEKGIR